MQPIRSLATSIRRTLLSGRGSLVTALVLLAVAVLVGFGWAVLLGVVLSASWVLGAPAQAPAAAASPPQHVKSTTPEHVEAASAPRTREEPTIERAYAKIGLPQLPPFPGLGEVATYDGPRKIVLMPDNPIEQRWDAKAYTMRMRRPVPWIVGRDGQGQSIFKDSREMSVPHTDITSVRWREPDTRFEGDAGRGLLSVGFEVGSGRRRTKGTSRPAYVPADQVTEFRRLRDAISASAGVPVTAAPTCLDAAAKALLHRASGPYQVMGPDGRPVTRAAEPL